MEGMTMNGRCLHGPKPFTAVGLQPQPVRRLHAAQGPRKSSTPAVGPLHVSAGAQEASLAVQQELPKFTLSQRRRRISWFKWERNIYYRLLEQEREQALLGGGSTDEWYYSYWDNPAAHQRWLEDQVRLSAWDEALTAAAPLLQGKAVLDLGCGTGTLALIAAQSGADRVFAVDASAGAAALARKVVAANPEVGRVVQVLCARGEVVELPLPQVDVILADWMGSMLLHNSMLPVLGRVRDRWLAAGGLIFPDRATLYVMAIDDREYLAEQKAFWGSGVGAGFNMGPVLNSVVGYPRVDTISRRSQMVTDAQPLINIDAYTADAKSLSFTAPFKLTAQRSERVSGVLLYFDAWFTGRGGLDPPVRLTTHPMAPGTNWEQVILSFPRMIKLEKGKVLSGVLSCRPAGPPLGRMLDLELEIGYEGVAARVSYKLRH